MTNNTTQIIILGAGYAGMITALRLAHKTRNLPVTITLINGSDQFVERVRLHELATEKHSRQRPIRQILKGTGVRFICGWVLGISPDTREITVKTDQGTQNMGYDTLVLAIGSIADQDTIPGVRQHAFAIGDRADSLQLRERLRTLAKNGGQVVVVGGGLTGIETVAEIAETYPALTVGLITGSVVGSGLSASGQAYVKATLTRLGVTIHENTPIARVEAHTVVTQKGEAIPFALCVWAGSFRASPLVAAAGVSVNDRGQMLIDSMLRSLSHASIVAAGDAAAFVPDAGVTTRMACATALPMGAHLADNLYAQMIHRHPQPFRMGYVAQCISLGRRDALIQGVNANDSPSQRIVTGRVAVWIKEGICRFAAVSATASWLATRYVWRHR